MAYPPLTAAKLAGISVSSAKNYSQQWPERFSPSANPPRGQKRSYTDADIATLRTIARLSRSGIPTEEIGAQLSEGELDDWQPDNAPQEAIAGPQQAAQQTTALVLAQQAVSALQTAFENERSERAAAMARIAELENALGRAEGELAARRVSWFRRLFGA